MLAVLPAAVMYCEERENKNNPVVLTHATVYLL
jgi:hypothetical protein